jgi:hypothetical protein
LLYMLVMKLSIYREKSGVLRVRLKRGSRRTEDMSNSPGMAQLGKQRLSMDFKGVDFSLTSHNISMNNDANAHAAIAQVEARWVVSRES